jgi:hypothetical protein
VALEGRVPLLLIVLVLLLAAVQVVQVEPVETLVNLVDARVRLTEVLVAYMVAAEVLV